MVEVAYNTSYGRTTLGEVLCPLDCCCTYGVSSYRINQVVSRLSSLWNFGKIAKEDAAEERVNRRYSEHVSKNRKTSRPSILFGLGAMNRIDQASGKLIMQKYFQLLTTIIWHVGFSSGKWNTAKVGGRRRKAHGEIRRNGGKIPGKSWGEATTHSGGKVRKTQNGGRGRSSALERSRRVDEWRRKRRRKEQRKNWSMRSVHDRGTLNARLWVEFKLAIEFRQRWRAVLPWVDTASRKCLTYPLFLLWLTSVSWDQQVRWKSQEGDNLGRFWGCVLLWLDLLV